MKRRIFFVYLIAVSVCAGWGTGEVFLGGGSLWWLVPICLTGITFFGAVILGVILHIKEAHND
jgi:hypothetical protein